MQGSVPRWGEVKKKTKDRAKSSTKEVGAASSEGPAASARSGRRGRGIDGRGGRGRGSERGRGTSRAAPSTDGPRARLVEKAPNESLIHADGLEGLEITAREASGTEVNREHATRESNSPETSWEMVTPIEATSVQAAPDIHVTSLRPDGTRSWASMLKPKAIPQQAKIALKKVMSHAEGGSQTRGQDGDNTIEGLPPPMFKEEREAEAITSDSTTSVSSTAQATPSQDELTKSNLDQVPDTSGLPPSMTAASPLASIDARSALVNTPAQMSNATGTIRPGLGGFATSAFKATSSVRSASYQRRFTEQQEAVVMPGKHAVDRTAVQFGSMGLNGTENVDVEDEREEVETRAQPPQQSPVVPRASLPPPPAMESQPTPRQAPGLPPAASHNLQHHSGAVVASESLPHEQLYGYGQSNRYSSHHDPPSAPKSFEAFGQQAQSTSATNPLDHYGAPSQAPSVPPQSSHTHAGPFASASNEYPSYTSDNQRNAYQNYYNSFGQPPQAVHESASLLSKAGLDHASLPAASHAPGPARYGTTSDAHSGHSTPNPPASQNQTHASQAPAHGPQSQSHGHIAPQPAGGFPYGHPSYYNGSPYYSQYMNQVSHHSYGRDRPMSDDVRRHDEQNLTSTLQYGYGGTQGYGNAPYATKYGQPHQGYGMSPHSAYEAGSSPANVGGFGQQSSASREAGVGAYGRSGSTQPSDTQPQGGNPGAFGAMQDVFSRAQAYQGQSSSQNLGEESARYSEPLKASGGPSPGPGHGRPGSATNQQAQAIPTGPGQPNYAAYPQMHGQHSQPYGSHVGSSGQQSSTQTHQGPGYGGAYGGGFGANYNYGNNSRGGWGGNYGH